MPRYFIKLSFDGTCYHGWQAQENANTVQSEIEKALSVLLSSKIEITGAGRTDAGVHAREYYAHFDIESLIVSTTTKPIVTQLILGKLNKGISYDKYIRYLNIQQENNESARIVLNLLLKQ